MKVVWRNMSAISDKVKVLGAKPTVRQSLKGMKIRKMHNSTCEYKGTAELLLLLLFFLSTAGLFFIFKKKQDDQIVWGELGISFMLYYYYKHDVVVVIFLSRPFFSRHFPAFGTTPFSLSLAFQTGTDYYYVFPSSPLLLLLLFFSFSFFVVFMLAPRL